MYSIYFPVKDGKGNWDPTIKKAYFRITGNKPVIQQSKPVGIAGFSPGDPHYPWDNNGDAYSYGY